VSGTKVTAWVIEHTLCGHVGGVVPHQEDADLWLRTLSEAHNDGWTASRKTGVELEAALEKLVRGQKCDLCIITVVPS
jgi:hypothetical protein